MFSWNQELRVEGRPRCRPSNTCCGSTFLFQDYNSLLVYWDFYHKFPPQETVAKVYGTRVEIKSGPDTLNIGWWEVLNRYEAVYVATCYLLRALRSTPCSLLKNSRLFSLEASGWTDWPGYPDFWFTKALFFYNWNHSLSSIDRTKNISGSFIQKELAGWERVQSDEDASGLSKSEHTILNLTYHLNAFSKVISTSTSASTANEILFSANIDYIHEDTATNVFPSPFALNASPWKATKCVRWKLWVIKSLISLSRMKTKRRALHWHNICLQDLQVPFERDTPVEKQSSQDIIPDGQPGSCDLPWSTTWIAKSANYENEQISLKDVNVLVYVLVWVMNLDEKKDMFCSALESKTNIGLLLEASRDIRTFMMGYNVLVSRWMFNKNHWF